MKTNKNFFSTHFERYSKFPNDDYVYGQSNKNKSEYGRFLILFILIGILIGLFIGAIGKTNRISTTDTQREIMQKYEEDKATAQNS